MKHPHAELMMQYAQDAMETDKPWERWEHRNKHNRDLKWVGFWENPRWDINYIYRRKPKTININGFEVPEPVRKELIYGDNFFFASPTSDEYFGFNHWIGSEFDFHLLKNGMVHLTREAASLHGRAIASFTEVKNEMDR